MVMDTTYEIIYFSMLITDIDMDIFQYNLPPSIKHMLSINNNNFNQRKLKKIKGVKLVKNIIHRYTLELIVNNN